VKVYTFPVSRWVLLAVLTVYLALVLCLPGLFLPLLKLLFLVILSFAFVALVVKWNQPFYVRLDTSWRRPYQPRDTGAGRWLEAPVAELDKSTIGKLLASRASRDPSLHVVVRNTPPPVCSDALYDAELDG
jgi:hypothetical protein